MSPPPQYSAPVPAPYTTSYSTPAPPPYSDRNMNYTVFSSPGGPSGAFLPHSAINLSVKTEEAAPGPGGQTQANSETSPQILDLTRPIR